MALRRQTVHIPLSAGLDTKTDPRAMEPPGLAVCQNAEFDEVGGIQTRKPFSDILSPASNTLTGIRKLAVYDDELLAFTQEAIWSWSSQDGSWTSKATYLAPKVDEEPVFTAPPEQYDCDRVEHTGLTWYCWMEDSDASTSTAYVAALDTATGAVVLAPEAIKASAVLPRLTKTTNKVMLTFMVSTTLWLRVYDPTDVTSSSETSTALASSTNYDIVVDQQTPSQAIMAVGRAASGYNVLRLTEAPAFTTSTNKATYNCMVPGVAVAPDGSVAVIINRASNTVYADILEGNFVDRHMGNLVATYDVAGGYTAVASACEFRSTQDAGEYRCYLWVEADSVRAEYNYVDTGGNVGTEAQLNNPLKVASRAFEHNGRVFAWAQFYASSSATGDTTGFRVQLQNTYFLVRDDGTIVAKAASGIAGGDAWTAGHLPHVQNTGTSTFSWCGIERRVIQLGDRHTDYAARSLRAITVVFDSDEARRTVQLGKTLYIAGGQVCQFDGVDLTELGFHIYPHTLTTSAGGAASGAGLAAGDYTYKGTYRDENAKGELDRSTTATYDTVTHVGGNETNVTINGLCASLRTGRREPTIEVWRTAVNPTAEAPFYLITSKDPASSTGDNRYVLNVPNSSAISLVDELNDTVATTKEVNPENGGTLESIAPPAASIIAATQDRIFLAGIPGHPHRIAYSKLRHPGEVAMFNDGLYVDLPAEGGVVTAIAFLNETLIVFKEKAIYALPGDGFDNAGGGQNYGPSRVLASDVGATSADVVALTPQGLIFKSSKGWYMLNRGWAANYIGGAVADFDGDTFVAVHLIEDQHQVRCVSTSRVLVWDYLVNQWSEWTIDDAIASVMYDGAHHYVPDTQDGNDNEVRRQVSWNTQPGLPPRTWGDGANFAAGSMLVDATDSYGDAIVTAWDQAGAVWIDKAGGNEETAEHTGITSTLITTYLANNQDDGAPVRRTWYSVLSGAHSAAATSLTVDVAGPQLSAAWLDGWPASGYITLSEGLAAEETVAYSAIDAATGVITCAALANNHADNAAVRFVWPEEMGLDIETGWIKLAGLQGYQRVRHILVLGEYRGPHSLRIRVARDYNESDSGVTWTDDKTWTVTPTTVGGPLQVRHGLSDQKCQAVKVRITAVHTDGSSRPIGEALKLTGLALELGVKSDVYKGLPAAQKQ